MLEGVLDKFLDEANDHLEPIRDEILSLDRLSFYFLAIGFGASLLVGMLLAFTVGVYAFFTLVGIYLLALGAVYYRNFLRQQTLQ